MVRRSNFSPALAMTLTVCIQAPAQVCIPRCRRGIHTGHWRRGRSARCGRPVRGQVAALRLHAVPAAEGAGQIRARGDIAITAGYDEVTIQCLC